MRTKHAHSAESSAVLQQGEFDTMVLKAPGILTFMLSVILVVVAFITKFFGATIPVISGHEFYVLLAAHLFLVIGCMIRGL